MAFLSEAGNKLVHNANPRTHKFVLGFLAKPWDFAKRNFLLTQAEQRQRSGDLYCGRGAQSRANGYFSMHQQVRSTAPAAGLFQRPSYTNHVITPRIEAPNRQVVQIELKDIGKFRRTQREFAVGTWRDGGMGVKTDGARQHKSIVVVGVLADQIHSSRRTEDLRCCMEVLFKSLGEVGNVHERKYCTVVKYQDQVSNTPSC